MPSVSKLLDAFDIASKAKEAEKSSPKPNEAKSRKKRTTCDTRNAVMATTLVGGSAHTFIRYPSLAQTWANTFPCCVSQCLTYGFPNGRLARIDDCPLINLLITVGVITLSDGFIGANGNTSGNYYWYDTPTMQSSGVITSFKFCNNSLSANDPGARPWNSGGPVAIYLENNVVNYYNYAPADTDSAVCECR